MKNNEINDLKIKDIKELVKMLADKRNELKKAALDKASGKFKNTAVIGKIKKHIALILTFIRQKEQSKI